ncbi:hypothetical protein K488DRAFT_91801 [Vararia minispora EC-137]|uniref:Uncharacterized protein n=1 Tax=Vararia minispora EC-137 TaxID=1314806 RepID=A0ACB8Q5E9_9AGAM|nr:hypothetical protein K488DRAFT_91801 [Vararia minispora EC-137]
MGGGYSGQFIVLAAACISVAEIATLHHALGVHCRARAHARSLPSLNLLFRPTETLSVSATQAYALTVFALMAARDVPCERVCLLDPRVATELAPADDDVFSSA